MNKDKVATPCIFETWVYKETGNRYHIESPGKMKNLDGEWIDCVTYTDMDEDNWYTRDLATFMEKFVKVEKKVGKRQDGFTL